MGLWGECVGGGSWVGTPVNPLALRVGVALRLAASIHTVYQCICSSERADLYGNHVFVYGSPRRCHTRHNEVNDDIKKSLTTAGCPAHREPEVYRSDNKHPDAISLTPGKTVDSWCGTTHVLTLWRPLISHSAGRAAGFRENQKAAKYRNL
ncbi:hypothetical protein Hamer_G019849 [Homarus americanus]|uniref:Uncharacterized protein n=1 Tax=Homarus americanus TaxID=6706 RepID=A0A8J5JNA4_HOMAM|nr:hypothetical protein Hamer_G019849 [Homarus americanus]